VYSSSQLDGYIQWTRSGDRVSGTLQIAYLSSSQATSVQSVTDSFSGYVNGESVTLSLGDPLYGTTNLSGTLQGAGLVLNIPESNGSIAQMALTPGSVNGYDEDVTTLQSVAASNLSAQQVAQQQQQEQAQHQQDVQTVQADATALSAAIAQLGTDASLTNGSSLQTDLSTMASDLQTESSDLQTTENDASNVENEAQGASPGDPTVCSNSDGVQSDADGVQSDADGINGDSDSVGTDLSGIASDIQAVQSALSQLQSDVSSLGLAATGAPSTTAVGQEVAAARAIDGQGLSEANGYIGQANVDLTQAYQAAVAANQAGQCGTPPVAPSYEPRLS
jgi:hypothetical protein